MRRVTAGLLVLAMLTTIPFTPGTLASDPQTKYGEALKAALGGDAQYARWADELGRFEVLLVGQAHALPAVAPPSREAWNLYWQEQAAAFFAQVRAALRPGDVLVSELATLPQAKVKAAPARIAELAALPLVRSVALDWPEAVHLLDRGDGPGAAMGQSVGMTQAFDVHALGFYGQGVKLANIDTGVLDTHPMLLDEAGNKRVTKWFDATVAPGGSGYCATPCDANGHGTHTMTTAAGGDVAGGRYQGVAPRAELYAVRIFQGASGSWEVAQAGLQESFDMGADLTTNSWGGGCGNFNDGGFVTQRLAETLALAGLQHIFAAGNSGAGSAGTLCPGRSDLVIGVAAVDKNKVVAGFSSGGLCPTTPDGLNRTRICPDVSAVGVNVDAGWNNGGYSTISGTSMATPHVAGGAVLMYQLNRALHGASYAVPAQELEAFFEAKAEDLGAAGNDQRYGWGFIRLGDMTDDLLVGAQGRATVDVGVALSEMRRGNTNTATVMVNNVGTKTLSGTVRITSGGELEHDGHTYLSQPLTLAPGAGTVLTASIPGSDLDPTKYHVVGGFDYAYTADGGATVANTVEDFASFILRGVKMGVVRAGTAGFNTGAVYVGNQSSITLQLLNVGNEPATNVELREGIPLPGFAIVPSPTANNPPLGSLSTPAPNNVAPSAENQTLDLFYTPASIAPGPAYTVRYKVAGAAVGAYDFTAYVTFTDAIGDSYGQSLTQTRKVICPAVRAGAGTDPIVLPC